MRRETYRRLSVAGQCILIALGVAWAVFERPAPTINVRWRDGVSAEERRRFERQLLLEAGEEADGSWRYDLGWPAEANIAAIVHHEGVLDTHHVNRSTNQLDDDVAFSRSRVWWVPPFRGSRGRSEFRYAVGLVAALTLIGAWSAGRSIPKGGPGHP